MNDCDYYCDMFLDEKLKQLPQNKKGNGKYIEDSESGDSGGDKAEDEEDEQLPFSKKVSNFVWMCTLSFTYTYLAQDSYGETSKSGTM